MHVKGGCLVLLAICVGFSSSAIIGEIIDHVKDGVGDVKEGIEDLQIDLFAKEIVRWARSGFDAGINRFVDVLHLPDEWRRSDWATLRGLRANLMCTICKSTAKSVLTLRRAGTPLDTIQAAITNLCTLLNLQTRGVCNGVVQLNTPIIFHIIDNDPYIKEDDVCGLILQNQDCGWNAERYKWTIEVDSNPPRIVSRQPSTESLKVLQITDIHYDPLYEVGGNADCEEPTCCRRGQNNTAGNKKVAGFWGDYNNCDAPYHAVLDALDHMKTNHGDADLIYFTGDIIDHGVWETSRSVNTRSLLQIFRKIKETFGNQAIYPIFGNHEPHPLNQFAPDDIDDDRLSTRWIYKLCADIWIGAGWLPESTRSTIERGGYYTVSPRPGFRIIAINNNVAYIYNWWLIFKPVDLNGQLRWLVDTLRQAEVDGEVVHILGHMPSGSPYSQHTWSREFRKIVHRFSHIISAHFNGHTHNDEFNVFYHPDNKSQITNVAWNGGSITTYAYLNPNYKVYEIDANTYEVEEADTWVYNLTEANLTPNQRPRWYKLYSFKEEYGLKDLSKESLHNLITDMNQGGKSLELYHKNFYLNASPEIEKDCDKKCLQEHICTIVTSSSDDKSECQHLESQKPRKPLFTLSHIKPLSFLSKPLF